MPYPLSPPDPALVTSRRNYALGAGLFILFVLLILAFYQIFSPYLFSSSKVVITPAGSEAFGSLMSSDVTAPLPTNAVAMGGGGSEAKISGTSDLTATEMPIDYVSTSYTYVFDGTLPDLSGLSDLVYKRETNVTVPSDIARVISTSTIGSFDLSQLSNLKLQNIYLSQDQDQGYSIGIDFVYGSLYLNQNWNTQSEIIYTPLAASEVPPFADLVAAADQFLESFHVDRTGYGAGQVTSAVSFQEGSSYIPDTATVVYPRGLDGKTIWDLFGSPQGILVYVNVRTKEVTGLNMELGNQFTTSSYTMTTDETALRDVLARGGLYGWSDPSADVVYTVKVGDPIYGLANYSLYQNGKTEYLYLPALYFPVIEVPEGAQIWQDAIVVPLTQEVLNAAQNEYPVLYKEDTVSTETQPAVEPTAP